jgi:hypothetical protein
MMHGEHNFQKIICISMDKFFDDKYRQYSSYFCGLLESNIV